MSKENQQASNTADRELLISRVFNAPRALVFRMFTEPEHVANWWGPDGFTNTIHKMDVKPGGEWDLVMHGPDGTDYRNKSIYVDVIKPELIVFDHVTGPKFRATIRLAEKGDKTELTWHMLFDSPEELQNVVKVFKADEGLKQNIVKLDKYIADLPPENVFTITRTFNVSRELVFKAFSEQEAIAQWWGPIGMEMVSNKFEFYPGGIYHYGMRPPGNNVVMWGKFSYVEIKAPERIVFISSFSDKDGNTVRAPFSLTWPLEIKNTLTLTEKDGKTTITLSGGPVNANDAELQTFKETFSGMQQGFNGTFDQLEAYLAKMA